VLWISITLIADPDSTYHPNADPESGFLFVADADSDFYLMRMRILIRIFTLMRIRIQILASK
jgi:hypothetical protein